MANIEIEIHGEDEALAGMERLELRRRGLARELLDDLADAGVQLLHQYVPVKHGYIFRHVDRTRIRRVPEGHEATVGIKRGTSLHPLYVNFGTGIYGAYRRPFGPSQSPFANPGQRPQHFLFNTWRDLNLYARARLIMTDIFK